LTGVVLGRLLGEVNMQRSTSSSAGDDAELVPGHCAYGVDGSTDTHAGGLLEAGDTLGPTVRVTITEALLRRIECTVPSATQSPSDVAGVEQGQPDPGIGRSPAQV
jgi:hypothetical protein